MLSPNDLLGPVPAPRSEGRALPVRVIVILTAVAGVIAFSLPWLARHCFDPIATVARHRQVAGAALLMGVVFIVFKSLAMQLAARDTGMQLSFLASIRVFTESVAVDAFCWPGELFANAYRAALMPRGSVLRRLQAVARFRGACVLASVALLLIAAFIGPWQTGLVVYMAFARCAAVVIVIALWKWKKWNATVRIWSQALAAPAGLALVAALANIIAMTAIARVIAGAEPTTFAAAFIVASMLGGASQSPLGLGVMDTCCWYTLTHLGHATDSQALDVIIVYRVTGPSVTVLLGALSLTTRLFRAWRGRFSDHALLQSFSWATFEKVRTQATNSIRANTASNNGTATTPSTF